MEIELSMMMVLLKLGGVWFGKLFGWCEIEESA